MWRPVWKGHLVFSDTFQALLKTNVVNGIKPGFHKANYEHDNDQFWAKTKRLVERMTAQPIIALFFCVVVVEFAVNGNQA